MIVGWLQVFHVSFEIYIVYSLFLFFYDVALLWAKPSWHVSSLLLLCYTHHVPQQQPNGQKSLHFLTHHWGHIRLSTNHTHDAEKPTQSIMQLIHTVKQHSFLHSLYKLETERSHLLHFSKVEKYCQNTDTVKMPEHIICRQYHLPLHWASAPMILELLQTS